MSSSLFLPFPLGFLPSFSDGSLRGNYGLMDTVAALHWVVENVAEFGGQPANVTLVATGWTGAAMAHLIALSPMAKGKLGRGIVFMRIRLSNAIEEDDDSIVRKSGCCCCLLQRLGYYITYYISV